LHFNPPFNLVIYPNSSELLPINLEVDLIIVLAEKGL